MKKNKNKILLILSFFSFLLFFSPVCHAMKLEKFDKPIVSVINDIALAILKFAGGIALFMLIVAGILYMISGANPELRNKTKKILLFAIFGLFLSLISFGLISRISFLSTGMGITIGGSVSPISGPPGTIFTINAEITATDGAVDPTTTIAYIQNPDETNVASITLFDDGAHSDGAAGDGIYGNTWNSGAFPLGPYFVDVEACNDKGDCTEAENI